VVLGTNDAVTKGYRGVLGAVAKGVQARFWIAPPVVDHPRHANRVKHVRAWQRTIFGPRYLDFGVSSDAPDGVHLTQAGYRRWAKAIANYILAAFLGVSRRSGGRLR
jgi:hypothetical protein